MIADEIRALAEEWPLTGKTDSLRALADRVEAVERDAAKWKKFALEMCQVHVCACGSGKTERDAMLGAESAEMAIEAGLVENGLPPLAELRAWYDAAIKEQADAD